MTNLGVLEYGEAFVDLDIGNGRWCVCSGSNRPNVHRTPTGMPSPVHIATYSGGEFRNAYVSGANLESSWITNFGYGTGNPLLFDGIYVHRFQLFHTLSARTGTGGDLGTITIGSYIYIDQEIAGATNKYLVRAVAYSNPGETAMHYIDPNNEYAFVDTRARSGTWTNFGVIHSIHPYEQ